MNFAFAVAELHIPGARSLKQKRAVVRPLVERIHRRYRVSIVESDHHDLHQRSEIALALVHRTATELDRTLEAIERVLDTSPEATLLSWRPQSYEAAP